MSASKSVTGTWLLEPHQISYTQGRHSCPYMYVKKSFKTQHSRIPIDPAILAAIRHRFIANKNADAREKHKLLTCGGRVPGRLSLPCLPVP